MNRHITREHEMIRKARVEMGYSQQELATLIGVQVRQYQRLEYGECNIQRMAVRPALILCIVLHISLVDLIFGEDLDAVTKLLDVRPHKAPIGRTNEPVRKKPVHKKAARRKQLTRQPK